MYKPEVLTEVCENLEFNLKYVQENFNILDTINIMII